MNFIKVLMADFYFISGSGTNPVSLLILLLLFFLLGAMLFKKSPRIHCLKSDWDENRQDCSLSKCALVDAVRFLIWRHTFTLVAMTSFHAEKCRHLVSAYTASAQRICSMISQLPASTSVYSYSSWSIVHSSLFLHVFVLRLRWVSELKVWE